MDMLLFSVSRDQWQQFYCGFEKKGAMEMAINLKNAKSRTRASLWLAGAVVAVAAIVLIPSTQSVSGSGRAQELAGRDSEDGLSGIGNAIQAVGADKEKSFQEAFQEAESKARGAETPEELSELQGGQEGQGQQEEQPLQKFLEQYFTELYRALSDDAIDFSHEDFASINGYIVGKDLISQRVRSNILFDGIHNVKIREVNISDISKNGTEAKVYVKHEWTYGMTPRHIEGMGTGYRVSLASNGNGYQVLDLEGDSKDCILAKEAIVLNSISKEDIETDYGAVDDFYGNYRIDSLQRMKEEQDKLEHK